MQKLLLAVAHHLWAKVMLALLPIVLLIFGIIFFTNIQAQNQILTQQTEENAYLTASAIEGGMFNALAIGNNDEVRAQFHRLHEEVPGLEVHIFDFRGDITFATQAARSGQNINTFVRGQESRNAVQAMLKEGLLPNRAFAETIEGKSHLSVYRPIQNESRCYHCHGQSREVLGGIHVRAVTETSVQAALRLRNRNILIGSLGLGLLSLLIYVLFHKLVNRPIREVLSVAGSMRRGDLTHTIDVQGLDEISHMSARMNLVNKNLRGMIRDIASASHSVATSASQQAASIQATSSSLEELTAMANQNSDHANQAAALMNKIATATREQTQGIRQMNAAVTEMDRSTQQNATTARQLSASTEKFVI